MRQLVQIALILLSIFLECYGNRSSAQAQLKPSIGLTSIPEDGDSACVIPLAIDPDNLFEAPGLHQGDTIPDFKLYTLSDDSMHIGDLLNDGKPVLLIGGSYTCPKYRNHLDELNDLQATYGNQVHIYIIYTVEAHPADPDISPYRGNVWELNTNDNQGIIYHEPVTYLDRKNTASDMLDSLDIQVPVLLDGPCNSWWQAYALAPNPAFLIHPNGTIYKKQGWFDNGLYAMSNAIDSLLQQLASGIHEITNPFVVVNDPSSSVIQFVFSEEERNSRFMLFDEMGRVLKSEDLVEGNTFILKKEGLAPGIYLYSIHGRGQTVNGKLLIQ